MISDDNLLSGKNEKTTEPSHDKMRHWDFSSLSQLNILEINIPYIILLCSKSGVYRVVYLVFLIDRIIDCEYLLEPPRRSSSSVYPQ